MAPRLARIDSHTSRPGVSGAATGDAGRGSVASLMARLPPVPDAGIEHAIGEIDPEIDQNDHAAD